MGIGASDPSDSKYGLPGAGASAASERAGITSGGLPGSADLAGAVGAIDPGRGLPGAASKRASITSGGFPGSDQSAGAVDAVGAIDPDHGFRGAGASTE